MTFFLRRDNAPTPIAPGPDFEPQSWFTGMSATAERTMLERDANMRLARERTDEAARLTQEVMPLLDSAALLDRLKQKGIVPEVQEAITPEALRYNNRAQAEILAMAREEAEAMPVGKWNGVDLSEEGVDARVNARLRAEYADLEAAIAMSPVGTVGSFAAQLAGGVLDVRNLAVVTPGVGGPGVMAAILRGASVNAAAEAAFLPSQFEMADRLNIQAPDVLSTLAMAAAGGAILDGGITAAGKAIGYFAGRNAVPDLPDVEPVRAAAAVEAAEEALASGRSVEEAVAEVMAPEPQEAPVAPAPEAVGGSGIEVLTNDNLATIGVDAKTFQFKSGGDDAGVTDRLRGVTTWEPERSGVALVYEYADGTRVIVDGHQRLGLAKRLAAEGKRVEMPIRVLREKDGVTVEEARARAALKNIAEGTGSPLDAAKVLRDLGVSASEINLPPNSALVRQGEGISQLSDDAFGMVVNERATEQHGALVGRIVKDKALHSDILALVTRLKPKNAFEAESIIRQANEAGATVETQASLFGDEMVSQSLFLERARVLDATVKRLKEDRGTFNVLLERSNTIAGAGNTLDAEANAKRFLESGELMQYVQTQANMKGPISDAITAAARDYKSGGKIGKSVDAVVEAVRDAIQRGDADGGAGRLGRGEAEPAPTPVAPEPLDDGPSLFDLPPAAPVVAREAPAAPVIAPEPIAAPDPVTAEALTLRSKVFDDPTSTEAQAFLDSMVRDLQEETDLDVEGMGLVTDEGTPITTKEALLREIEENDTLAREIELCRTGATNDPQ